MSDAFDELPIYLKAIRAERKLGLREVEKQSGISHATLSRIENGHDFDIPNTRKLCVWLGLKLTLVPERTPTHDQDT